MSDDGNSRCPNTIPGTFGAAGMGIFPAAVSINDDLLESHKLENIGSSSEIQEEFHLIYTQRKVLHPLLTRLLS